MLRHHLAPDVLCDRGNEFPRKWEKDDYGNVSCREQGRGCASRGGTNGRLRGVETESNKARCSRKLRFQEIMIDDHNILEN